MLILPPGHAQALRVRRRLSSREKWLIGGVLAGVAALIIGVVIALSTAGHSSSRGCIYATIPGAVGAQQINQCGDAARSICASANVPGSFTPDAARAVAAECRKAGLPVRP